MKRVGCIQLEVQMTLNWWYAFVSLCSVVKNVASKLLIYAYTYLCVCVCVCARAGACVLICINDSYIYMFACEWICRSVCIYMCILINMHIYIYIYIHIYIYWHNGKRFCQWPRRPGFNPKRQNASFPNKQYNKVRIKEKWSNPGKRVAPSPIPKCRSYWKGSLQVALD